MIWVYSGRNSSDPPKNPDDMFHSLSFRERHAERLLTRGEGPAVQAAIRVEALTFAKAAGVAQFDLNGDNPVARADRYGPFL